MQTLLDYLGHSFLQLHGNLEAPGLLFTERNVLIRFTDSHLCQHICFCCMHSNDVARQIFRDSRRL